MNNVFTAKLLQNLQAKKKGNKGFTLIELLVVVIIIGVLAAVALPNLLAQVGKARETEAKNAVGTINRGQQAFHFDGGNFTVAITDAQLGAVTNPLGVAIDSQYYDISVTQEADITADSRSIAAPVAAQKDGVRNYAGGITFATASGLYGTVLCQGPAVGTALAATDPTPVAGAPGTCATGTALK